MKILHWQHTTGEAGHSGRDNTLRRVKSLFTWKGLTKDVSRFVKQCTTCQASKSENTAYPGLLQPLPIPEEVWVDISMDFIMGLPKSQGKNVIFVVVDRLSKNAHFMPLSHPFTAVEVAQCYLDNVFKLHGWPRSIVSDRDAVFLSQFWKGLFSLHGTEFKLSSAYHPQTDGQTEVVNRCLEAYLRCMCGEKTKEWSFWLPLAEWWFNTHYQSAIGMTPYEVVYNQPPPRHLPYLPGESNVEAIDRSLRKREMMINSLKQHLTKAQVRMKQQADKHRSERTFNIGDWVWLKLQPYRQQSVHLRANQKLSKKYYGPFQISAIIGTVAYKIKLPTESKIHDVFHVSQLKKFVGKLPIAAHIPPWFQNNNVENKVQPAAILGKRTVKFQNALQMQYLVQWSGFPECEATWESIDFLEAQYPGIEACWLTGVYLTCNQFEHKFDEISIKLESGKYVVDVEDKSCVKFGNVKDYFTVINLLSMDKEQGFMDMELKGWNLTDTNRIIFDIFKMVIDNINDKVCVKECRGLDDSFDNVEKFNEGILDTFQHVLEERK
ncbi:hypothetical protein L1887_15648 [Cichorium endivia]|nr:hypothetical protein L1887_15648 [Cichorium endivia]